MRRRSNGNVDAPTIEQMLVPKMSADQNVGVPTIAQMSAAEMSEGPTICTLYSAVGRANAKFLFHVKPIVFLYRAVVRRKTKSLVPRETEIIRTETVIRMGQSFERASQLEARLLGIDKRAATLNRLAIVIASVCFIADDGKVTFGGFEWIGLPRKSRGGYFNLCFQLAARRCSRKSEMPGSVFIAHGLSIRFPNDLEAHPRGSGYRVERRPARLIYDCDVTHFYCAGITIGTEFRSTIGNGNNPVKSRWRDGRMKVMNLIGRDSLSLK
jgi:hypothetical protein